CGMLPASSSLARICPAVVGMPPAVTPEDCITPLPVDQFPSRTAPEVAVSVSPVCQLPLESVPCEQLLKHPNEQTLTGTPLVHALMEAPHWTIVAMESVSFDGAYRKFVGTFIVAGSPPLSTLSQNGPVQRSVTDGIVESAYQIEYDASKLPGSCERIE